jgi:very-short-patch-repair endonuclease
LAEQGFHVLRFWNHDVLKNLEGVLGRILESARAPSSSPSPPGEKG